MVEPPVNLHIADYQDGQAILEWRLPSAVQMCPSVAFSVTSNCSGTCTIISNTNARCSVPPIRMQSMDPLACAFSVQSIVCGSLPGRPSIITLQGINHIIDVLIDMHGQRVCKVKEYVISHNNYTGGLSIK